MTTTYTTVYTHLQLIATTTMVILFSGVIQLIHSSIPPDNTGILDEINSNSNINDLNKDNGFININKKMSNITGSISGKITLMCDITGKPSPKITWKKGRLTLTDIPMKLAIKDKVWGGLLKILDLDFSDEGWYSCIGENIHGKVNTSAYLTISKKKRKSNNNAANSNDYSNKPDEQGFCQTFQSSTCGQYFSGQKVYVSNGLVQSQKERRIASLIAEISSVLLPQSDRECLRHLMRLTCHSHFLVCSQDSSGTKKHVPRQLCKSDCDDVTKKRCNYTYKLMLRKLRSKHLDSLPTCDGLNDEPDCFKFNEILPQTTQSGDNNNNINVNNNKNNNVPSEIPKYECYNGTGVNYDGKIATTVKSNNCLTWKLIPGYDKYEENYCRSPILENIPPSVIPWCFISLKGDWEQCPIPKCKEYLQDHVKSTSHLLPIYIAVSGVAGFVFLLIVVCWICRRSYFGLYKPCHGGDFKKPDSHLMQLNKIKINCTEYPLSQIRFQEQIGEGIFGPVYKAELLVSGGSSNGGINNNNSSINASDSLNGGIVAASSSITTAHHQSVIVKTLSAGSSWNLQRDFKREAQMMCELRHVNVLGLMGVSMRQIPWCLIFEGNGAQGQDLHELLVSCCASQANQANSGSHQMEARSVSTNGPADSMDAYGDVSLTYSDQIFIATQIASGMEYLSSHCFVHRDLAARNVLVSSSEHLQCRICDVGLVRERYSSDYYRAPGSNLMLPIRWMPPEAISHGNFTRESDVWSFAVLLWELWSAGLQPFYGHSNAEVIDLVRARQILPQPDSCPNRVYELMLECWNEMPRHRPLFRSIHARLRLWQQEAISPSGPGSNMAVLMGLMNTNNTSNITNGAAMNNFNSQPLQQHQYNQYNSSNQQQHLQQHHQYNNNSNQQQQAMINCMSNCGNMSGSHSGGSHSRHTTSSTEMCSDHSHLLPNGGSGGGNAGNHNFCPSPPPSTASPPLHCPFTNSPVALMQHTTTTQYDSPPPPPPPLSLPPPSLIQQQQYTNNNNQNYLPELSHIV